ncbi:MAG: HAMP domain-containing protein [Chloroflexi bacterium]|nr:HAMP domain-containing protein [Chloroflexota bacterium]
MSEFLHSLQFRLVIGFVSVLALSLAGVGAYASYATQQELNRFEEDTAAARVSRLENVVAAAYEQVDEEPQMTLLQPALRNAAELFNWRIAVVDQHGRMIAGSHNYSGELRIESFFSGPLVMSRPIIVNGAVRGQILFESPFPIPRGPFNSSPFVVSDDRIGPEGFIGVPDSSNSSGFQRARPPKGGGPLGPLGSEPENPERLVEPQLSKLAASFNKSLMWAGLAAAAAGVFVISLTTRQALAPVHSLTRAAGALGRGELSQRVPVKSRDEVGQLSHTFNDMAAQLEDAEVIRRTMTADVAHELRTPLSNLQGYLEAINDGLIKPDTDTINSLHSQVMHLTQLVEDLRLIAMVEAGSIRMEKLEADLGDIADLTVDSFKPRASEHGISLSLYREQDLPLLQLDNTRMRQVLANLVENAINYTPDDGSINVSVSTEAGDVVMAVTDTGRGIPADDVGHVFDRLYRVDVSRNRTTGGAGLGLTIVKQLVEAHGGTVSVESPANPDGSGSRFMVRLPV